VHAAVIDDAGAGLAPQLDGRVIAADLVADFLEQLVGVALDGLEALGRQQFVLGDRSRDVGRRQRRRRA
jgi:hypothetical protein